MIKNIEIGNYLKTEISGIKVKIFLMKVKDVLKIYYVSRRGESSEQGAVQRILTPGRIESVKEFIINGNMFFNTFILNWSDNNNKIIEKNKKVYIPLCKDAAQVIDGQHRLAGLTEAVKQSKKIREKDIIVIFTENLSTIEAARIFLNINAEQKPVSKSLMYDLFGECGDKDSNIVRAVDIADILNNDENSPYNSLIRRPVEVVKEKGKIELSVVVNSLKEYTKVDGVFNANQLKSLEAQSKALLNYFNVISSSYKKMNMWTMEKCPFLIGAGFTASIAFFAERIIPICYEKQSFSVKTIKSIFRFESHKLLYRDDLKNIQGKAQRIKVYNYLNSVVENKVNDESEFEF